MMPKAVAAIIEKITISAERKRFPQWTPRTSDEITADSPMPTTTADARDANLAR